MSEKTCNVHVYKKKFLMLSGQFRSAERFQWSHPGLIEEAKRGAQIVLGSKMTGGGGMCVKNEEQEQELFML